MDNLKTLFKRLPSIGWGDPIKYEQGNVYHISEAVMILNGGLELTVERADYLRENQSAEESNISDWLDMKKKENSYVGYMLRNFELKNDEFLLNITEDELNDLAGVYLKYKKIKK